jgi:hypothetical protein
MNAAINAHLTPSQIVFMFTEITHRSGYTWGFSGASCTPLDQIPEALKKVDGYLNTYQIVDLFPTISWTFGLDKIENVVGPRNKIFRTYPPEKAGNILCGLTGDRNEWKRKCEILNKMDLTPTMAEEGVTARATEYYYAEIGRKVSISHNFNGAHGGIENDTIDLFAGSEKVIARLSLLSGPKTPDLKDYATDPGIAMLTKQQVGGYKMSFEYSGRVVGGLRNNSFTVLMIKAAPFGGHDKDVILKEIPFAPKADAKKAVIDIPEGTDKINVMLVGTGMINISLDKVLISK